MKNPAVSLELSSETGRQARWASTMHGYVQADLGAVVTAHADSTATIKVLSQRSREQREEDEALHLSDGATRSIGGGQRAREESPDPYRTCYERDRDRIVHSSAFRRLAGKTQVFVFPDDHQRTRLTHALEVAQVAVAISSVLRLNVALTEAIALGHDCGHGPGGHPSEDVFSKYLVGGFDHAPFGADVMLAPLNLCAQTLDGIRNHSWSRPASSTPEGEVVSWADRIAYVCHDFEDARSTGIVSDRDLPSVVRERCGITRPRQIAAFIDAILDATTRSGRVGMFADDAAVLAAFREANYERIYFRSESVDQARRVRNLLDALVDHYGRHPEHIASETLRDVLPGSEEAYETAVTYVAGMTDRFAVDAALRLLDWPQAELPQAMSESYRR